VLPRVLTKAGTRLNEESEAFRVMNDPSIEVRGKVAREHEDSASVIHDGDLSKRRIPIPGVPEGALRRGADVAELAGRGSTNQSLVATPVPVGVVGGMGVPQPIHSMPFGTAIVKTMRASGVSISQESFVVPVDPPMTWGVLIGDVNVLTQSGAIDRRWKSMSDFEEALAQDLAKLSIEEPPGSPPPPLSASSRGSESSRPMFAAGARSNSSWRGSTPRGQVSHETEEKQKALLQEIESLHRAANQFKFRMTPKPQEQTTRERAAAAVTEATTTPLEPAKLVKRVVQAQRHPAPKNKHAVGSVESFAASLRASYGGKPRRRSKQ
jgi:hypothetical protein